MKEPKEEPLDDYHPLMSPDNEVSNQTKNILKEPKEEPLNLFERHFIENEAKGQEIKEEEVDDDEDTSQFDVNAFGVPYHNGSSPPFPSEDEAESLCGEELVMKKKKEKEEKLRKKAMQYAQVPSEEIDVQQTRTRIVTRPVKYGDFLMDSGPSVEKSTLKVKKNGRTKKTGKEEQPFQIATETPKVATIDPTETAKKSEELNLNIPDGYENAQSENIANGHLNSLTDDRIDDEEKEEEIDSTDTPKDSSETLQVKKEGRPLRNASKIVNYDESSEDSEGDDEPIVKKMKSDSVKKKTETPKCVLCEMFPSTLCGYVRHLWQHHKSNLLAIGVYLKCTCGYELRCRGKKLVAHNKECDGRQFTLHKLIVNGNPKNNSTKCILCEKFPSSTIGYTMHLKSHSKSTLKANGVYLKCVCSFEVLSDRSHRNHKKCDGRQFTIHKLNEKEKPNTPMCILCEAFPSSVAGYTHHLWSNHKSSLKENGIYLKCACSFEVLCHNSHAKNNKKCDGRQFTLHKINEK